MSHPSASASPSPAAGPFTAATTGWGRVRSARTRRDMCSWLARRSRGVSLPTVSRRGSIAAQIDARAEAAACAGQDHRADAALGGDAGESADERLAELRGHRVEPVGPVHGQPAHVRCGIIDEQHGRHRRHANPPRVGRYPLKGSTASAPLTADALSLPALTWHLIVNTVPAETPVRTFVKARSSSGFADPDRRLQRSGNAVHLARALIELAPDLVGFRRKTHAFDLDLRRDQVASVRPRGR